MFGDVELNKALTAITSFLLLFETSVEIPLRDLPRLLHDLDSRTKSDFLSNDAIRRALDACPEPTAGYLIEKKYRLLLAAELCSRLHEQKTWLANLLRQREYFVPDQNAYIVPVSHLSALKETSP
jgi:hypothetical protein